MPVALSSTSLEENSRLVVRDYDQRDETTNDGNDSETTTPGSTGPGFTFTLAILAVGGTLGIAIHRA